jgi:hypothetical protein
MGRCRIDRCTRFYGPMLDYQKMYRHGYRGRERGRSDHLCSFGIPRWAPPAPEQEIAQLKAWAEKLKNQLKVIQKRIDELEGEKTNIKEA